MLFKKKNHKSLLKKHTKTQKYKKMFVYIIITNYGYSETIIKNLKEYDCNVQFTCLGQGTAKKEVMSMLGLGSSNKGVILAFVDESNVHDIRKYLDKYFKQNKRVMGVGFTVPVTSIVGEKMYHFLTNSL